MFSGNLDLTNLGGSATGSGFLSFASDGRFQCGGVDFFSSLNTCQLRTSVFGTEVDEKVGNYSIEQVTAAVPLPASLVLMLGALGSLGLLRRRSIV